MNIVVLAGGTSPERDVSLSSGSKVAHALRAEGYRVVLIDLFFGLPSLPDPIDTLFDAPEGDEHTIDPDAPDIAALRAKRQGGAGEIGENVIAACRAADIVYLGLHGMPGEEGRIQAMFDLMGIKYTGSGYLGSAMAMHKGVTKSLFAQAGVPTPEGRVLRDGETFSPAFPCIVKPVSGGSSIGTVIARDEDEFEEAVRTAHKYEDEILVETYIAGREFSVGMLGDEVLPPIEIIPRDGFYDYRHKYQSGLTVEVCPAQISDELCKKMQDATRLVFDTLKLEVYGRADFMVDAAENIYCLEANTLPGMTNLSLLPQEANAAGIPYTKLCARIIELSLEKYRQMKEFTLAEAARACGGTFHGEEALLASPVKGVVIDNRQVQTGDLFVPIKGDRFDGHDFILPAFRAGALCTLSEQPVEGKPYILVESTLEAFQRIAAYYKSLMPAKTVAITGSSGKTSTKELVAAVLSQRFRTLKSEGNLNNQTGVPLTVFRMEEAHKAAVIEMGTNHFGEIRDLARIVRPDYCLLTNIGTAHIENFGSREGILEGKTEVLEYMKPGGTVFLNGDDDLLAPLKNQLEHAVTYGLSPTCDVSAKDIAPRGLDGIEFTACFDGQEEPFFVPSPGQHMVQNALAAIAVGLAYGMDAEAIRRGIASYVPAGNRMRIRRAAVTILDDTYNANPESVMAGLAVLSQAEGRKVCILSDMLELGENAAAYHGNVGRFAAEAGIDLTICVGGHSAHICSAATEAGGNALHFAAQEELWPQLAELVRPGDTVLVKASRGMALEKTVARLLDIFGPEAEAAM